MGWMLLPESRTRILLLFDTVVLQYIQLLSCRNETHDGKSIKYPIQPVTSDSNSVKFKGNTETVTMRTLLQVLSLYNCWLPASVPGNIIADPPGCVQESWWSYQKNDRQGILRKSTPRIVKPNSFYREFHSGGNGIHYCCKYCKSRQKNGFRSGHVCQIAAGGDWYNNRSRKSACQKHSILRQFFGFLHLFTAIAAGTALWKIARLKREKTAGREKARQILICTENILWLRISMPDLTTASPRKASGPR